MKTDKRFVDEFNVLFPPASRLPPRENIIEAVLGSIIPFMFITLMLAAGALIGRLYPPALWWFLGGAGLAALWTMAMFALALVAVATDDPMDGGYPGS